MRTNSILNITAAYNSKKEQDPTLGLHIVDCKPIDSHSIKMLVASASDIKLESMNAFVFEVLDHKLIPFTASFTQEEKNDGMKYASIIAYRSPFKIQYEANRLIQVNANSYLDEKLNEIWQKAEVEGKTLFFRKNDESIESITSSLMIASSNRHKVTDIRASVNNLVEFYFLSSKGEASKVVGKVLDNSDNLTIESNDVKYIVPPSSVIRNISVSAGNDKKEILDYLKMAYSHGNNEEYEEC